MPINRCQTKGKSGYKYGDSGKRYKSRTDALEQMRAIKASQSRKRRSK